MDLSYLYPTSMNIPCETPIKLQIFDTWRKKLHLKKKASFRKQIRFQLLQQLSLVVISRAKSKAAWNSSQISGLLFYSCQRWSVSPEGQGESAATAPSGFSVQLDRGNRPLSSPLEAKEVKAGKDAEDGLNKALFLPSLKRKARWHFFFFFTKERSLLWWKIQDLVSVWCKAVRN